MAFCLSRSLSATMWKSNSFAPFQSPRRKMQRFQALQPRALFNPFEDPILKEALKLWWNFGQYSIYVGEQSGNICPVPRLAHLGKKEPVAFASGVFAGLLRLDLNDDPLKEWLTRTVEASGITKEEIDIESSKVEEDAPQQIEIE